MNKNNKTPIYLKRCFKGWEKIRKQYIHPDMDGDIILWIDKDASIDAKDAQTIIDFLQTNVQTGDFRKLVRNLRKDQSE